MSNKTRNTSLDAVKGFTILIVMLGHVLVLNRINDPILYDWIKAVQVPLFMMVSGYLCGRSHKVTDMEDYGGMLKKRAIGYLLPFFAWTLVFHLDDFTWAFPAYLEQPERGLWFLITLFVLTFMVYTAQLAEALVSRSATNRYVLGKFAFWSVYGLLALAVAVQNAAGIPWLGPHLTKIYIPYYMAAYLFGEYEGWITGWLKRRALYAIAAAGGVFCLVIVCVQDMMVMNGFSDYIIQMLASFGGCMSVITFFYHMKENRCKRFLSWLGMYTLEIYSIHYHFAKLLNPGELTFMVYSPQWILFTLGSFAVMSILTGVVIWAAKRFKITNFLLYGKR